MTLKVIKHETTKLVEKVKIKAFGDSIENSPEYEAAVAKYESMKSNVTNFCRSSEEIIKQLNELFSTVSQFGDSLEKSAHGLTNGDGANLGQELNNFAEAISKSGDSNLINRYNQCVIMPLKKFISDIEAVNKDMKIHYDNMLILTSNLAKLEKLKTSNKNPEKIAEYEKKIENRQKIVNDIEENFFAAIDSLWARRITEVHDPIMVFATLFHQFIKSAYEKAGEVRLSIGPTCDRQLPSGDIPQFEEPVKTQKMSLTGIKDKILKNDGKK
ncbi:hypothetical protein TRFO_15771 [Tritrichomonas foetus]|uniref:BAR domain-containing protein n=1 Tax=Tritrichomonas foetus TaxID=1144522 RepID=A0A1J4KSN3_9EUKA|nr:hypothetical protein TRFO_15771 [Tritrichomonas foetus]|eukprot:OHT13896.1 hypothetical protein TRFO_15771 [Tritrichomonas foetus]